MGKPLKYTKVKVLKLTETQFNTLKKLEGYNVPVCDFIRAAIAEKINREHKQLKPKAKKEYCPL